MANSVLNYIINVVKKGGGDKQTVDALQSVKSVMTGVGIAAGVATTAYVAFDKTILESSRKTVKYADEVRNLMSVTKQNAKETSIMKQVADDYKVTNDQLLMASKKLATQGYALNIKTLAELSDKYKSLSTAQEKQQFLTKNFGKTGQDYITLLEAGGAALLKNADAVNKNLILTEQQVRAARDLEIAQDDLADAQEAYSIAIGTKVIPTQIQFEKGLARLLTATSLQELAFMRTIALMETEPIDSATRSYMAMAEAVEDTARSTEDAANAQTNYNDLLRDWKNAGVDAAIAMKEMGYAALEAQYAVDGTIDAQDFQKLMDYRASMGLLSQEEYNAAMKAKALSDAIRGMPAEKVIKITTWYLSGYGSAGNYQDQSGSRRAAGGPVSPGFTMVGEHGPEIITPDGMVHSNAESRRMIAAGITPFRSLAVGGAIFSEPGDVFNPVVTPTGIASASARMSNFLHSGGFTAAANNIKNSSSSSSTFSVVENAAATNQVAEVAAQNTAAANASIMQTGQLASQLTQSQAQNAALLQSIDRRLANIPAQIRDAFQQVIQQ